ncbi:hypothetical protein BHM03_00043910, partial [Ensete ventricosum]
CNQSTRGCRAATNERLERCRRRRQQLGYREERGRRHCREGRAEEGVVSATEERMGRRRQKQGGLQRGSSILRTRGIRKNERVVGE